MISASETPESPESPESAPNQEQRLAELGRELLAIYAEADPYKYEGLLTLRKTLAPELDSDAEFGIALVHAVRKQFHESTITDRLRNVILDSYGMSNSSWEQFMKLEISPPTGLETA